MQRTPEDKSNFDLNSKIMLSHFKNLIKPILFPLIPFTFFPPTLLQSGPSVNSCIRPRLFCRG